MCCRPFAIVILSLVVHGVALDSVAGASEEPGTKQSDTTCLSGTRSPEELADRIAKLLSSTRMSDLDGLMSVSDCTAALAAGWERVRRTMPDTEEKDVVRPHLQAISLFLGLIEGRLEVSVPKTWEDALKSARGHGPKRIWFPRWDGVLVERRKAKWLLERDGNHLLVKNDKQLIKLPEGTVLEPASHVTVELAGEWVYAAVYSSLPDSDYKLFAIEQATGKLLWSSHVWGTSRINPPGVLVNHSGSDWHVATMRLSGETLVVFGFSGSAVYVEAFDRKTGENRCRFSTAYLERVSP